MKKKLKYSSYNPEICKLIEADRLILDIGCATGELAKKLKEEKNCLVYGVEIDKGLASKARKRYQQVFILDIKNRKATI